MSAEAVRSHTVELLRRELLGPANGPQEKVSNRPDRTYLVGTLFPRSAESMTGDGKPRSDELHESTDLSIEASTIGLERSNEWMPSSMGLSFIHDGGSLQCEINFGKYHEVRAGRDKTWQRTENGPFIVEIPPNSQDPISIEPGLEIYSKWRNIANGRLVTISLVNTNVIAENSKMKPEQSYYQVSCRAEPIGGKIQPYRTLDSLNPSDEELELELRYRNNHAFAIGHGIAVSWTATGNAASAVETDALPVHQVSAIAARESGSAALSLSRLAELHMDPAVLEELQGFVDDYSDWISNQRTLLGTVSTRHAEAAQRINCRQTLARDRMQDAIKLLRSEGEFRRVVSIAMSAMREQMLQSKFIEAYQGARGRTADFDRQNEPRFRMFQLAFVLVSIPSTLDPGHPDRDLVDLVWFPTGGGKTEAYLALAAIEIIHRRLMGGARGGGTAVLTRYTLRLLTAQQFQRAATLICALERIRTETELLPSTPRFTIGLWVGNETTPRTEEDAIDKAKRLPGRSDPKNPFQLDTCPWCNTKIVPRGGSKDIEDFGFTILGKSIVLNCPDDKCEFSRQLPVEVIDSRIFDSPPTILLATVDKFARLPFLEPAGILLGTGAFDPPSLIIQDELHLLSGQLGTTVGIFDSAVFGTMEFHGGKPKIVASTATIRAAGEQVRQLMSREVSIFPPAGIVEDDSYFATPSSDRLGRTYIGLMPQAFTQATSMVRASAAFLNAPLSSRFDDPDTDAYWTLVAYHNSLRELGRTAVLLRDDVPGLLANKKNPGEIVRALEVSRNVELTGHADASDLPAALDSLRRKFPDPEAVDTVICTNMLSVGIDVSRLAGMIMNGLPKTTSEYIQATSRVGRSRIPGIVLTYFRPGRSRDRSVYENFHGYHQSLYRYVEPTSVTPWSSASRKRTLPAAVAALVRHGAQLRKNGEAADFEIADWYVDEITQFLVDRAEFADSRETENVRRQLEVLFREWSHRKEDEDELQYYSSSEKFPSLLKGFGDDRVGWSTANSMRSVDDEVRIKARFEKDED